MAARPNWKILTVGAALAGLGITGTGIAMADGNGDDAARVQPIEVTAAPSQAADAAPAPNAGDAEGKTGAADQDSPDNTPDDDTPDNG